MLRIYSARDRSYASWRRGPAPLVRPELDHSAWQREFRLALHKRNQPESGTAPFGRKYDDEWQIRMRRDRNRLADIAGRIRVYQFETPEIDRHFGHLLAHFDD